MIRSTMFLIISVVTLLFIIPGETRSLNQVRRGQHEAQVVGFTAMLFGNLNSKADLVRYTQEWSDFFAKATPTNKHLLVLFVTHLLTDFNNNDQADLKKIEDALKPVTKRTLENHVLVQLDHEVEQASSADERAKAAEEYGKFILKGSKADIQKFEQLIEDAVKLFASNDNARIKKVADLIGQKVKREMLRDILIERLRQLEEDENKSEEE
jgi:hypothetical protein